ncbi:MAG: hypothetical protein JNL80_00945 [Phycisphaerae bacterium]|nr:hypothetical protein [Phycisphaerae bacterium]
MLAFAPIALLSRASLSALAVAHASGTSTDLGGCPLFPPDNIWNVPVDTLPVDPNSAAYIQTIGANVGLHPDFGTFWEGAPIGIPYIVVPHDQTLVEISFYYPTQSDPGPYPIPPDAPIEGGPESDGDRHILIVQVGEDGSPCTLWEIFDATPNRDGTWSAGSGARWDLSSNVLRPDGWTSADAAGLPILPGLVRYDEVLSGSIDHALRFTTVPTRGEHLWPARHDASPSTNPAHPPMGQRFRLKASYDISGFPPEVRTILQAMKTYGIILADNGSDWYITGTHDTRWDDEVLSTISAVKGSQFEAVDVSSLMVDADSGQAAGRVDSDLTGDGLVNAGDLALMLGAWGSAGGPADLNGDGTVDAADLSILLGAWTLP